MVNVHCVLIAIGKYDFVLKGRHFNRGLEPHPAYAAARVQNIFLNLQFSFIQAHYCELIKGL